MFKKFIIPFIGFSVISSSASALVVSTSNDANALASEILGSGITISNATYSGGSNSSALFSDGSSSGLGMDNGILLTTGNANYAVGPNTSDGSTGYMYTSGDSHLDGLVPGYTTYDASVLEFDFTTDGGDLYFNYQFASEEYNEWVNSSYNDVFGFFLDGVNIALIPGTTDAVSINNVNNGSYSEYYNDNDPSDTSTPYDIGYDGFTDMFTAVALGIGSGTHHIKLAIADAGDRRLDSGVFIQAGSFSDVPDDNTSVPEPTSVALLGLGLVGLFGARRRKV
jgi:hypothetical protein